MKKLSDKLFSWASVLDPNTEEQAHVTSKLDFVKPHVALMPDAHFGMGSTVGSVIPTQGAIIPAAIGVDIGCFSGDTLIPTLDGDSYEIEKLSEQGGEFVVYASDKNGKVVAAKATAKKTRKNAELVKVTLDNGRVVRCTPDHQFMLRDGGFEEAKNLKSGQPLMPLYRETDKDGCVMVQQNYSGRLQRAHWLVARSGLMGKVPKFEGQKTVIHHKNFCQSDNRPENLEFMGNSAHSSYHRSLVERNEHWQSEEFELRRKKAISEKAKTTKGHAYFAERGTKNLLNYMSERYDHFKESVRGNGKRGKKFLIGYNKSAKGRAKSREIANRLYECETCGEEVKSGIGLHNHRKWSHGYNHKVVSVEPTKDREDVYCLTVPEHGNFALEEGVFVHNCGMFAVRTDIKKAELVKKDLGVLRHSIERSVPSSAGKYNNQISPSAQKRNEELKKKASKDYSQIDGKWEIQMGTLGSGNHFIEIVYDENDDIWAFLHSGSRGIGNKIAQKHIKIAQENMRKNFIKLDNKDLAYLVEGTPEFDEYIEDMLWAQDFALLNREEMMDRVLKDLRHFYGEFKEIERVNTHHNFTQQENHMGKNVWLTRKGAIKADKGMLGLIPGSMGTPSYVVIGKGFAPSFNSCPHGAGRVYSRSAAKKKFNLDDLTKAMEGIEYKQSEAFIDEIPSAYKDIFKVMEDSSELCEVKHTLKQILNVKGN